MKWIFGIGLAAFLCHAVQAAEKLEPTEWRWTEVMPVDGRWETVEGPATVEIAGGKVHAALRWRKEDSDPYYDITGSIQMQRPEQYLRPGKVTATVKRGPTDYNPFFQIEGTYFKLVYDAISRKSSGMDSLETIMLHDGFKMIGLTRQTKIVP